MQYAELRRVALRAFIGFLVLTAAIAIITVLSGSWGEVQWKTLGTTFTVTVVSLCAMCDLAFIEKRRKAELGWTGLAMALLGGVLSILLIWTSFDSETLGKFTVTIIIAAIAFAHGFLLALPDLDVGHRWVQGITDVTIAALALLLIGMVWGEGYSDVYARIILVTAILVALETLVIPILLWLRKKTPEVTPDDLLVLKRLPEGIYQATDGRRYRVIELTGDSTEE